jgi:RNA polymerase sigma-70 factor, ECF subfamily
VVRPSSHGDRDAIRALYDNYKDKVYSIALFFFHGDAATASDITQQVFLKVMTEYQHFRGDSALSTWLYRVVVNTCIDSTRGRKHRALRLEHSLAESVATECSPEDDFVHLQRASLIQSAISALPPNFRVAILLRYFDDLSYEEMARAMNCSVGTVSSRLSRGHRILAKTLEPMREWLRKGHP